MWGGDCLKFKCYLNNPAQLFTVLRLTTNKIEIDEEPKGQSFILNSEDNGYIGDAFLCRSAVKNNKVYVYVDVNKNKIYKTVINITDNKCDYDVRTEVKYCFADDTCAPEATFNIINVSPFPEDLLFYKYEVNVCKNNILIRISEEGEIPYDPDKPAYTYILNISNYIKNSNNNVIELSYMTADSKKFCYTLTKEQYKITNCSSDITLLTSDFEAC
jgi:hypothetical protein